MNVFFFRLSHATCRPEGARADPGDSSGSISHNGFILMKVLPNATFRTKIRGQLDDMPVGNPRLSRLQALLCSDSLRSTIDDDNNKGQGLIRMSEDVKTCMKNAKLAISSKDFKGAMSWCKKAVKQVGFLDEHSIYSNFPINILTYTGQDKL